MRVALLKVNESQYWSEDIRCRVKCIWGVYVLDPHWRVYCCELTPSYELHRLNSQVEFLDGTPQEIIEEVEEEILEAERFDAPVIYVHCHTIDRAERFSQGWFPKGSMGIHTMAGFGSGFQVDPNDPAERRRNEQKHDYAIEEALEYCHMNGV